MTRYLIIIEPTTTGFSAYLPDVPGCVATGRTRDQVEANMRSAIEAHLEELKEDGTPVPPPSSIATYVDVAAQIGLRIPLFRLNRNVESFRQRGFGIERARDAIRAARAERSVVRRDRRRGAAGGGSQR